MKKITILFLMILTVSLCACTNKGSDQAAEPVSQGSGTTASESQTDTASGQTETASPQEIMIEVAPPEGWAPVEGSVLPVQYMKNTASFMVKAENFTGDTLDAVIDEAMAIYKESFEEFKVQGDIENITVDGKEAKKLIFTCAISDLNMKYQYVYLFAGGKTYVITFGDLADSFDSLATDYDLILGNIKFEAQ